MVSTIYPLEPFANRKSAARSFGWSFFTLAISLIFAGTLEPNTKKTDLRDQISNELLSTQNRMPAINADVVISANIPLHCGNGGLSLLDIVAVSGEHELRAEPDVSASRLRNEKASALLGKDHYHQIDKSMTVRRLCQQSGWTEVQIVSPDWLGFVRGWVSSEALREIDKQDDGSRIYVENDFYWDDVTTLYRPQIVAIVNKIAHENNKCREIDTYSISKSGSRSKPNDIVFYVTCGSGANAFNVWFRPTDAETGEAFDAKQPIQKSRAIDACEMAARNAATHPSTVSFSRILDLAYMTHSSGRARIVSSFTAKNAVNLKLKYRIDCLFDGASLIETYVAESTN